LDEMLGLSDEACIRARVAFPRRTHSGIMVALKQAEHPPGPPKVQPGWVMDKLRWKGLRSAALAASRPGIR
jgi:hypothetical protein